MGHNYTYHDITTPNALLDTTGFLGSFPGFGP